MKIIGRKKFKERTREALELLETSQSFQKISSYIETIGEGEISGIDVFRKTFKVSEKTWTSDLYWYASCIAHDAYHSFCFSHGKPWIWEKGEKESLAFQIKVLEELNAPERFIVWCQELLEYPESFISVERTW